MRTKCYGWWKHLQRSWYKLQGFFFNLNFQISHFLCSLESVLKQWKFNAMWRGQFVCIMVRQQQLSMPCLIMVYVISLLSFVFCICLATSLLLSLTSASSCILLNQLTSASSTTHTLPTHNLSNAWCSVTQLIQPSQCSSQVWQPFCLPYGWWVIPYSNQ